MPPEPQAGAVPTVLDSIISGVLEDLRPRKAAVPLGELREKAREAPPSLLAEDTAGFLDPRRFGVISEVKRASPSKGALAPIPDPAVLALDYQAGGAKAVSVLTEGRRFNGSLADLDAVRAAVGIPVLRKDFLVEEYQIWEARAHGADLVLLIVAALDDERLAALHALALGLGMLPLVETHDVGELERAARLGARLVGVNTRSLKTLHVDTGLFGRLRGAFPPGALLVAESGVEGVEDVRSYARSGAHAVLVGEALVRHGSPSTAVRSFTDAGQSAMDERASSADAHA